ncbi:MAG: peptide ABC transporter ATP-binding protein [Candidatus Melainabacteria bacterium HGW-Melainabacteria-1]|nr:MAG: peptide ABC transporter ATP-binding protein [Candidatus Melainabacteria bacterium HGW-Melainabacteria-1]
MSQVDASRLSRSESALVSIEDVDVSFDVGDGKWLQAGRGLNLKIKAGEMIAVIGESGCGKSTLGKLALGVLAPSRGQVRFDGHDVWAPGYRWPKAQRLGVQVIHQDPFSSLNPVRTLAQILAPALKYHRLSQGHAATRQRVHELLVEVGLTPTEAFIDKYPFQLSGGQKQRVSIARATLLKPRLIIADEPVAAVDSSLRLAILDLMKQSNREQGTAFLYITHDLATARYFAPEGQLVVMYLGRMVETGQIEACISRPAHPYLQALLAAIPGSSTWRADGELPLRSLEMPSPIDPPSGCVFHPRCPYADARCADEAPSLRSLSPGHEVACHHAEDLNHRILTQA